MPLVIAISHWGKGPIKTAKGGQLCFEDVFNETKMDSSSPHQKYK